MVRIGATRVARQVSVQELEINDITSQTVERAARAGISRRKESGLGTGRTGRVPRLTDKQGAAAARSDVGGNQCAVGQHVRPLHGFVAGTEEDGAGGRPDRESG